MAYQRHEQSVSTGGWKSLAEAGARDQGVTTFDASWDCLGQRLATALGTQKE